jgi:hypothetical protein
MRQSTILLIILMNTEVSAYSACANGEEAKWTVTENATYYFRKRYMGR